MIIKKNITSLIFILLCNFAIAQKQLLKIGVFADCQAAQTETRKGRCYTKSATKLKEAITEFNDNDAKLVVSMGDLIDRDLYTLKQIDTVLQTLKKPFYHVLGNHDFLLDAMDDVQRVTNTRPPYYRSIKQNGVRLILLNSNENAIYTTLRETPEREKVEQILAEYKKTGAMNAQPINGMVSAEQMKWIEEELKQATAAKEVVVVMSHHPLIYLNNMGTMLNNEQVISLLEKYDCVKAHISGHFHLGGHFTRKNIHYLVLLGMVETSNNRYAMLDIYDDRIVVEGRGDEQSREMKFTNNH